MRVLRPVILLILLAPFLWIGNTGIKYQHNQVPTFGLTTQQQMAFRRPAAPTATPTPLVKATLTPTPELRAAVAEQQLVETKEAEPTSPPATKVEPGTLEPETLAVWITFYYCKRTVEMRDDGGGYCTKGGIPLAPGVAACPVSWWDRSFTIVGDESGLVYTCKDTGSGVTGNQVDIWFYTNGEGWSWPLRGYGAIVWQD